MRLSAACGLTRMEHFFTALPSGAGNQKKYTISLWVKRTAFLASLLDVSFLGAGDGTTYGISGTGAFGSSLTATSS